MAVTIKPRNDTPAPEPKKSKITIKAKADTNYPLLTDVNDTEFHFWLCHRPANTHPRPWWAVYRKEKLRITRKSDGLVFIGVLHSLSADGTCGVLTPTGKHIEDINPQVDKLEVLGYITTSVDDDQDNWYIEHGYFPPHVPGTLPKTPPELRVWG